MIGIYLHFMANFNSLDLKYKLKFENLFSCACSLFGLPVLFRRDTGKMRPTMRRVALHSFSSAEKLQPRRIG